MPLVRLSGTAQAPMPMALGPSAPGVVLRILVGIALVIALFSVALHFILAVVVIAVLVVLFFGALGRLIVGLAIRLASTTFWLLGMRRLAIQPPSSAHGLGFRVQVGPTLTFVQLRGGVGRVTARDSITVIGRRTFQGVVKAYVIRNHTDGSWIVAKGVAFACVACAFLVWVALARALQ